jgi:YrbI family 3-deoxy-D-manno-octulosonate 8-phosphate phosphatase
MSNRRHLSVAVIPARGGSKGIPRKNLEKVGGLPLVARAVRAATAAELVDRVVVSTDDDEIAEIAASWGAEIVRRPGELSTDSASSEDALIHAIDELGRDTDNEQPEVCVLLQCTSPFVTPTDIDATIATIADEGADSALSATPHHGFLWRTTAEGAVGVNHDASVRLRRQDLDPEHLETGGVYAMKVDGLRRHRHRFFGRVAIHEVPRLRSMEIDDHGDLALARALAPLLDQQDRTSALPHEPAAVVFDFDGVMTDNRAVTLGDGTEGVVVHRGDGFGIEQLRHQGFTLLVLSKERDGVVGTRCRKLGVEFVQAVDDKWPVLEQWLSSRGISPDDVIFVGNDVNDLECLQRVGCAVVVADAHPYVRAEADIVLSRSGGDGAVRELADLLIAERPVRS